MDRRNCAMLVLSRSVGHRGIGKTNPKLTKIRIGGGITITILSASGDRVRVGVEAPPEVSILRDEIDEAPPASPATIPPA
jgi:carbon storage regulator CsrA